MTNFNFSTDRIAGVPLYVEQVNYDVKELGEIVIVDGIAVRGKAVIDTITVELRGFSDDIQLPKIGQSFTYAGRTWKIITSFPKHKYYLGNNNKPINVSWEIQAIDFNNPRANL